MPAAIAVLDVGRTDVKLFAIAPEGTILSSRQAPNAVRTGDPYPNCDVEHLWRWLMAALADLGERFAIRAIVPASYGSTAALVADSELVLPILDYEADPPAALAEAYAEVAPWFEECCCPIDRAGLTLGRQLFWQSRAFAEEFARVRWILPFAQYWAWGLCGVPASEVTSFGAQTQLWNPRRRDFSSLVRREGWDQKFPPLRNAWDVLGPLQFDIAEKTGLSPETPVLCGIHDGAANFARYLAAGLEDFTLISAASGLMAFNPGLSIEQLDPMCDVVATVDLLGRPVACARLAGEHESAMVGTGGPSEAGTAEVEALIARGSMPLPSEAAGGSPSGSSPKVRIVGPPPRTAAERTTLATLHLALLADARLELLKARGQLIIDGGFADNPLFAALLAALRPGQPVAVATEREGTALGAALLVGWGERKAPVPLRLRPVEPALIAGLDRYAREWRATVTARAPG